MTQSKFDGLIKSMTVSVFASLPTAWPEYLWGGGKLIAKIHDNCLKAGGEPDVIARVLVEVPGNEVEETHLARLTIRYRNTELDYSMLKDFPEDQSLLVSRIEDYRACLEMIAPLPVVDLHDPFKTWPVSA